MLSCASIKSLTTLKDVTPALARQIRSTWLDKGIGRNVRRETIDRLLGTFGVEYLGTHKRTGAHLYYCNAGDTYAPTIMWASGRLYVGCWGDLFDPVERVNTNH